MYLEKELGEEKFNEAYKFLEVSIKANIGTT